MTTPVVPKADAALLAAQAEAGKAGVQAYEAAKAELSTQKQQAVQDAAMAASLRGAPEGAMEQAMAGASQMYGRYSTALTTAQAAYQDAMASRAARMQDYNAGVNEARGLIDRQAQLVAAPIDAQTRYAVAGIEAQGRMRVDEIEAQRRLMELEMAQAAARAAASRRSSGGGGGGGGTKSKGTLTGGELEQNLRSGGTENLRRAAGAANTAAAQTAEQRRQGASYTAQSVQAQQRSTDRRGDLAAEMARQAAAYAGRSMQEWNKKQSMQEPSATRVPAPTTTFDAARAAYERVAQQQRARQTSAPQQVRETTQRTVPSYFDMNAGLFTAKQLSQFANSPDAPLFDMTLAGGPQRRIGTINETLLGTPSYLENEYGAVRREDRLMGAQSEFSPEAFERAMIMAALDLSDQGYKINEAEVRTQIENALRDTPTAADAEAFRVGGSTIAEQQQEEFDRRREVRDTELAAAERRADEMSGYGSKIAALEDIGVSVPPDVRPGEIDAALQQIEDEFTTLVGTTPSTLGLADVRLQDRIVNQWEPEVLPWLDLAAQLAEDAYSGGSFKPRQVRDDLVAQINADVGPGAANDPYWRAVIQIALNSVGA